METRGRRSSSGGLGPGGIEGHYPRKGRLFHHSSNQYGQIGGAVVDSSHGWRGAPAELSHSATLDRRNITFSERAVETRPRECPSGDRKLLDGGEVPCVLDQVLDVVEIQLVVTFFDMVSEGVVAARRQASHGVDQSMETSDGPLDYCG